MDSFENLDLEKIRLSQDYQDGLEVKKIIENVPVRRPDKQEYIRVHTGEEYTFDTYLLEFKEDRRQYLVAPDLIDQLVDEARPVRIFTAINRQKVIFLWPIPLPRSDTDYNSWHRSAMEAAEVAKTRWIRVKSNRATGTYDVFAPQGNLDDPEWPEKTFEELVRMAFKDSYIDSTDHKVVKHLRGVI